MGQVHVHILVRVIGNKNNMYLEQEKKEKFVYFESRFFLRVELVEPWAC